MFLNNQQVTEEIKREIKKSLETNDNENTTTWLFHFNVWQNPLQLKEKKENTTTQNLWDAAKTILRAKFIMIQSYLKKQEKHQIDNLTLYLKQLEKEQKNPPKLVKGKKS